MAVLNNNKKIICKNCGHIYPIEKLEVIQDFRMKCMECPTGICEIKFDDKLMHKAIEESNNAVWSNQEFEIINAINMLSQEFQDNVTVKVISGEIDYNYQLITGICKSLAQDGYVKRNREITPNTYKLADRAKDVLKNLYIKSK
ncbi:hypothetical protein G9F71_016115 [Clostridium sp. FP2]|uniref:hypothetical protein n=1 Tax=Clostridium sp. FP2 TaxID=2724481 RepID=UPI0013E904A3|nr:hypothetical protein [Clostridium sp. FP2]MBZ9624378.1 hypothetical protein [Clostridium sp. FP2]